MPTNPTTKSQVQAYRFVLRRMESALVRKDSAMVHEPMRNHLRASGVGVILAVLGLAAFYVVGLFSPTSQVSGNEIIIVKQTGQVFVVQDGDPLQLIAVPNLTSARLLYAAFAPNLSEPPETKFVEESALDGIPRMTSIGLEGAPETLPAADEMVQGDWSVCDTATVREELPDAESRPELSTTVVVGVAGPGRPLTDDEALLVEEEATGARYLVHSGQRLQVAGDDAAVRHAYRLDNIVPRKVSAGLLNAIPEGRALSPPDIPGADLPAPAPLGGVRIGDVVQVNRADGPSYYLVLRQGTQQVDRAVADLLRFAGGGGSRFPEVAPEDIAQVPTAPDAARVNVTDFPARVPTVVQISDAPIACAVWQDPATRPVITVSPGSELPLGEGRQPVELPGGGGQSADSVFVEPGKGALVRGVSPGQPPDTGAIWLVTEQGVAYSVPSIEVARALGLGERTTPAPGSVLKLLKFGPALNPQDALVRLDPEHAQGGAEQQGGG